MVDKRRIKYVSLIKIALLVSFSVILLTACKASSDLPVDETIISPTNVHLLEEVQSLTLGKIIDMAPSPAGNLFAISSAMGFWIYDLEDGSQVGYIPPDDWLASVISWDSTGEKLAIVDRDSGIRVLDAYTLELILHLPNISGRLRWMAWSPDDSMLAAGGYFSPLYVWDAASGELVFSHGDEDYSATDPTWSPDSQMFAVMGGDDLIHIWDISAGSNLFTLVSKSTGGISLLWSPDGNHIAQLGGWDAELQVWNAHTGKLIYEFEGESSISAPIAAWSANGSALAYSFRGSKEPIRIWHSRNKTMIRSLPIPSESDYISPISLIWDAESNQVISSHSRGELRYWNPKNGMLIHTIQTSYYSAEDLFWTTDGELIGTTGGTTTAYVFAPLHDEELLRLEDYSAGISLVRWSPNGKWLAATAKYGTLKMWDTENWEARELSRAADENPFILEWSPDSKSLAFTSLYPGGTRVWNFEHDESEWNQDLSAGIPFDIAWSPSGSMLAISTLAISTIEDQINVYSSSDGELLFSLQQPSGKGKLGNRPIEWSRDGRYLASSSADDVVSIWEVARKEVVAISHPPDDLEPLSGVSFKWSPTKNELIVWWGNGEVQMWAGKWRDWGIESELRIEANGALTWSPNGEIIMSTVQWSNIILFWDAETGELLHALEGHVGRISSLAWSPDGRSIATASSDGTIRIWSVPISVLPSPPTK